MILIETMAIIRVASILHVAYECLPRVKSVIQADFIAYGGPDTATPNIITYSNLPKNVALIVAAHTEYTGDTIQTMKFTTSTML